MKTVIKRMKKGELPVDSLADYWEFLTLKEKREIPVMWMVQAWENSSLDIKADIEKTVKEVTKKEFRSYLVILKNTEKVSKDFFAVIGWIKRNFNDLVKKVYLDNFLRKDMSFGPSF